MKVINRYVNSIKELNTVYNKFMFGKHNIFRNKRRKMKLESSLFPLTSAYIDLIDDRNNYRIHYTVKSEHK